MLVVGIVVFALGLLFSIAWHELGHCTAAQRFGVRVPQYMVGFGPTLFSPPARRDRVRHQGRPAGRLHPHDRDDPARPRRADRARRRSGPFAGLIDDVRADSARDDQPGDEDRQFWTRKPWQRIVVMFAGPFMNLILAAVLFIIVLMGFGIPTSQPVVSSVSECVVPASQATPGNRASGRRPTPAAQAGFRPVTGSSASRAAPSTPGRTSSSRSATRPARCPSSSSCAAQGRRPDPHALPQAHRRPSGWTPTRAPGKPR